MEFCRYIPAEIKPDERQSFVKQIVFLISFFSFGFAHAGFECTSPDGDRVNLIDSFQAGTGARIESKKVTAYYRRHLNVKINYLESIIDPETGKYATDTLRKGYQFAVQADDTSVIGNVWGFEWIWASGVKASAVLMDMEGNKFEFELKCAATANLE